MTKSTKICRIIFYSVPFGLILMFIQVFASKNFQESLNLKTEFILKFEFHFYKLKHALKSKIFRLTYPTKIFPEKNK